MAKRGRPSDYSSTYHPKAVFRPCLLGATDKEIAEIFEISEQTLNTWKAEHPEFLESIKKGKIDADSDVAHSLYKRACGFSYDETTKEPLYNTINGETINGDDGKPLIAITKIVSKHVAPDTAAAFIWLKNRRGWKDKQQVEHSGNLTVETGIRRPGDGEG